MMEAALSLKLRVGVSEGIILALQNNLANTYQALGRDEEALRMRREVYSGRLKLLGEDHPRTLLAANNYASLLKRLKHFGEAKSLLRKTARVALRVLGEGHDTTLKSRWIYARALCEDPAATLDEILEAATTLEETEPTARRVLGGAHPITVAIADTLRRARAALHAREAPPNSA